MWGEIPLGKPFGIELRLHGLFFVTLLLAVISQAWVGPYYVAWAVVLAGPVLLVTIYLHELGHCLASKMVGAEVHYILLWPLGGLAFVGHSSTPARDLFVALLGPLTHVPQILIWVAILALSAHVVHYPWQHNLTDIPDAESHFWLAVCVGAAQLNIWLMAFNLLLPAYPLDGGRILVDLLLICRVPIKPAAIVTVSLAVCVAVLLLVWGFVRTAILTIAVGAWMLYTTWDLIMCIKNGTIEGHPMFLYEGIPTQPSTGGQPHSNAPEVMLPAHQPRSAEV